MAAFIKSYDNKMIVINSLQWLVQNNLVKIYGCTPIAIGVPNHILLIWEKFCMNGKEYPKNTFEKFTAKTLVNKMKQMKNPLL